MGNPFTVQDVANFLSKRPSHRDLDMELIEGVGVHLRDEKGNLVHVEEVEQNLTSMLNAYLQLPVTCLVMKVTSYSSHYDPYSYRCYFDDPVQPSAVRMAMVYSKKNDVMVRENTYQLTLGHYHATVKTFKDLEHPVTCSLLDGLEWLIPQTPLFRLPLLTGAWKF